MAGKNLGMIQIRNTPQLEPAVYYGGTFQMFRTLPRTGTDDANERAVTAGRPMAKWRGGCAEHAKAGSLFRCPSKEIEPIKLRNKNAKTGGLFLCSQCVGRLAEGS